MTCIWRVSCHISKTAKDFDINYSTDETESSANSSAAPAAAGVP